MTKNQDSFKNISSQSLAYTKTNYRTHICLTYTQPTSHMRDKPHAKEIYLAYTLSQIASTPFVDQKLGRFNCVDGYLMTVLLSQCPGSESYIDELRKRRDRPMLNCRRAIRGENRFINEVLRVYPEICQKIMTWGLYQAIMSNKEFKKAVIDNELSFDMYHLDYTYDNKPAEIILRTPMEIAVAGAANASVGHVKAETSPRIPSCKEVAASLAKYRPEQY